MKIDVVTVIGETKFVFHIEEQKEIEALHKAAVLGNPPKYCNLCKNGQYFSLDSNKDKEGNVYVNVVCKKCGAKAKLGQYKVGGYFFHKFKEWKRNDQKEQIKKEFDGTDTENIGDAI